ncbi:MAG: acetyltransferase-like isoleucine patch superfamily enzyme [Crocinitomix sp.]|jgi:acetyltransferase-like isoleucine patch superfamily enzyme
MDRKKALENKDSANTLAELQNLHADLFSAFKAQFDRSLPFNDEVFDRWERAKELGWGKGSSVYDSAYIFGDAKVGENTWIGPFTIVDGSGGLAIGNHCTVSAGVHIYTHSNLKQTLSGGKLPIEREPVKIGSCTYIAPQCIIGMGITIGNHCVIAANSFVGESFPDYAIIAGNPAKQIGRVVISENDISFDYSDLNEG